LIENHKLSIIYGFVCFNNVLSTVQSASVLDRITLLSVLRIYSVLELMLIMQTQILMVVLSRKQHKPECWNLKLLCW